MDIGEKKIYNIMKQDKAYFVSRSQDPAMWREIVGEVISGFNSFSLFSCLLNAFSNVACYSFCRLLSDDS